MRVDVNLLLLKNVLSLRRLLTRLHFLGNASLHLLLDEDFDGRGGFTSLEPSDSHAEVAAALRKI